MRRLENGSKIAAGFRGPVQLFMFSLWCVLVGLACTPEGGSRAQPGAGSSASPSSAALKSTSAGAAGSGAAAASAAPSAASTAAAASDPKITPLPAGSPLKIGATLHPYYSWTKNVVGDSPGVEVRSVLPGEVDAGNYQPRPDDIKKLADLDAIVVNGIGHDDFITDMIKASGNTKIVVIRPNDGTPTMKSARGGAANSHTFISFTNAIQQTSAIEKALSALRPDLAERFRKGASDYVQRLRKIKSDAATKLAGAKVNKVVSVHDGYSYFCQEFGVEVAGVVEPSHGLVPSAAELGSMVDLLKREKIQVVLSEESFPDKLLQVLKKDSGARVYVISHVASGDYTADKFEKEMAKNTEVLIKALVTD
jgi:zinc transport system substrate-binding protein